MLKTISAALLAASMIAAPALAADSTSARTQAHKATQTQAQAPAGKTGHAQIGATRTKSNGLNANAEMIRHHRHKKVSLQRSHPKVSYKHVATKRS